MATVCAVIQIFPSKTQTDRGGGEGAASERELGKKLDRRSPPQKLLARLIWPIL